MDVGARVGHEPEAQAQAQLNHANVAHLYEYFQAGSELYMAMEFVNGYSLAKLLHDQGRVAPEQAVALLIQTLDGLHYAHERNVVKVPDDIPAELLDQACASVPDDE